MKVVKTIHKISACLFRRPVLTGLVLAAVPALVSAAIVGVLVWTLMSLFSCIGIPSPIWAWRPLTHLSWWVCILSGMALAFLVLLSLIAGNGIKNRIMNFLKAVGISVVVACVSIAMVLLLLLNGDEIRDCNNYENWDDLSDDKLLVQLVPRSAVNIKRLDFGGFKSYQCDVSCTVSLQGLEAFAKEHGYVFKLMDLEDAVMTGMIDQDAKGSVNYRSEGAFSKSDFLGCSFNRKTQSGMSQHFEFVYDMAHQKLYCRYSDG